MEKVDLRSESKLCALSRNWFKSFSSSMMLSFKLFFEEICQSTSNGFSISLDHLIILINRI